MKSLTNTSKYCLLSSSDVAFIARDFTFEPCHSNLIGKILIFCNKMFFYKVSEN